MLALKSDTAWREKAFRLLQGAQHWNYSQRGPDASEPMAWASLSLLTVEPLAALPPARRLLDLQDKTGAVGVTETHSTPSWPTTLAIITWQALLRTDAVHSTDQATLREGISRGLEWMLKVEGETIRRNNETQHNTELVGWPWVIGTHSWLEPSALALIALKCVGHVKHPRAVEAIKLVTDRLLPEGGCNCGNTIVLDQILRPHIQPSGLAAWALADCGVQDPRLKATLSYLEKETPITPTCASLSYAIIGLAAHGRELPQQNELLAKAATGQLDKLNGTHKLSLLLAAANARKLLELCATRPEPVEQFTLAQKRNSTVLTVGLR